MERESEGGGGGEGERKQRADRVKEREGKNEFNKN
jgi:hypothetical protein